MRHSTLCLEGLHNIRRLKISQLAKETAVLSVLELFRKHLVHFVDGHRKTILSTL